MVTAKDIRLGIRGKFILFAVVFISIFSGIISFVNMTLQEKTITQGLTEKALSLSSLLEQTSINPLIQLRIDYLRNFLAEAKEDPEVIYAYIYDKDGRLLTDGTEENLNRDMIPTDEQGKKAITSNKLLKEKTQDIFEISKPLLLSEERVGTIRLGFSLDQTHRKMREIKDRNILAGSFFIAFGIFLAYLFSQIITKPILTIASAADAVARGDLSQRVVITSKDEIGVLAYSFNQMTYDLQTTTVSKRYLDDILSSMIDPLIVLDINGNIKTVNEATPALVGWSKDELLNQPSGKILPPGMMLFPDGGIEKILAEKKVQAESQFQDKDGKVIPVAISASVMTDKDNQIDGFVCVAKDITERKRLMEDLKRSNSELELFAYIASHDLQEPLRMVSSYVKLLENRYQGKLDKDADEFIHFAVDGALRMRALIDDLLTYSRVGTRQKKLEQIASREIFDAAVQNLEVAIHEKQAEVTCGNLPVISADRVAMGQLFQNLMGNALKFQAPGVRAHVHVEALQKGSEWEFSVQDNGIGIDPKYKEKIFEIFQRLHLREQYPGTGIGLAVCKKIVQRHGGNIWVESEAGKGATFKFTLPVNGGRL